MIGLIPAARAASWNWRAPNIDPWSVRAIAGIPWETARATIRSMRAAPSSSENSLWLCRWTKPLPDTFPSTDDRPRTADGESQACDSRIAQDRLRAARRQPSAGRCPIRRLSHSSIETYDICPAKWKFQYVERIPRKPSPILSFGNSLHAALESFYRATVPVAPSLEELLAMLDRSWLSEGYPSPEEEARNRSLAVDILTRFHRDNAPTYALPAIVEEKFEIDIDGVPVSGQIDRMDRLPSGGYEILDYKTSRRLPTLDALRKNRQLSIYHLAVRETRGIDPERLTLYFLMHGQPMSVPGRTEADLEATRRHIVTVAERIEAEKFEPKRSALCNWCDFQPICPLFRNAGERLRGESDAEIGAAVDEWVRLHDEVRTLRARMDDLGSTILSFSIRHDYGRLFSGDGPGVERRRRELPADEARVREVLGAIDRLDEVLSVDPVKLARLLERQDLPPEVEDALVAEGGDAPWELRWVDRPRPVGSASADPTPDDAGTA